MNQHQSDKNDEDKVLLLWDFYAANALIGIIASNEETWGVSLQEITESSFDMADAMLKERKKRLK